MLRAMGITKSYGSVTALAGADLDVAAGQIVALLGRNGAGKTTLLSIVAGLVRPDGGTVELAGIDALADPVAAAGLIGIAPQETGIYPVLTVAENLQFFAEITGVARADRQRRVSEAAGRLGLEHLLDRRGAHLSGGEARRLHTACALLHRPGLLMLDEPTVGADVTTRQQLIQAVKDLASEGAAVIYTTHYLPEVELLDADIVIIDDGRVLARGTRDELVTRHHPQGLEFELDGPLPPGLSGPLEAIPSGEGRYRIDGAVSMAQLLTAVGPDADRLRSVERPRPDLESVFLAVTGSSLDDDSAAAPAAGAAP